MPANTYAVSRSNHLMTLRMTGLLMVFLIWPFVGLIIALREYHRQDSRRITYYFMIFYGLILIIDTGGGADASRYAANLGIIYNRPFSDFWEILFGLYSTSDSLDILQPLISFIVSRFTNSYHILFGVFAALFGYFYIHSINQLHDHYLLNRNRNAFIHLIFFSVILSITAVSGVRMWIAAWMYFWGAYHVVLLKDRKYLLLCLAAIFMHWSFISANVVLLIYVFAGNRNSIYIPILVASFIIPQLLSTFLPQLNNLMGEGLQGRIDKYSNPMYIRQRAEVMVQARWFLTWVNKFVLFYIYFAIVYIRLKYRNRIDSIPLNNLFSFILLFLSFANFSGSISSGGRFHLVFMLFGTMYIFYFFAIIRFNKLNFLTWVGLIPMILYAGLVFRQASESISIWIFGPSPIALFAPELSISKILFGQ